MQTVRNKQDQEMNKVVTIDLNSDELKLLKYFFMTIFLEEMAWIAFTADMSDLKIVKISKALNLDTKTIKKTIKSLADKKILCDGKTRHEKKFDNLAIFWNVLRYYSLEAIGDKLFISNRKNTKQTPAQTQPEQPEKRNLSLIHGGKDNSN